MKFDSWVVCIVVAGYIVYHYCLRFDRGVVHIVVASDIVDQYCLRFVIVVVILLWLAILLTITI